MTSNDGRTVRALIQDAIADTPDQFELKDVIEWFAERDDPRSEDTVRLQLLGATYNVRSPWPGARPRPDSERTAWRLRLGRPGQPALFTRYRPEVHGEEGKDGVPAGIDRGPDDIGGADLGTAEPDDSGEDAGSGVFALEQHLEDFMDQNWASIDFGRPLRIWTDEEGVRGRQYYAGEAGIIDFLCEDASSNELVVVELKRRKSSDSVVGQTLRYIGWVDEHLADGRSVSGIIITHEYDDHLRYAVAACPRVEAWTYGVSFTLDTQGFAS